MKKVIQDLYWEAMRDLEKIHRKKMLLSERIALESALTKLDAIKKLINVSTLTEQ